MYVLGVDPGLSGALAVIDHAGALVALADTPTLTLRVARGTRHDYDVPGMVALLASYVDAGLHVFIEASQAMPGQGTRSMFTIGYGYGLWLGILAALQVPYTPVRPVVWKKAFSLGKDKEAARLRAQQLFPAADLRRKRNHGRAEALLLAHWALADRRAIPHRQPRDRADHGSTPGEAPYAQGTSSERESIASHGAGVSMRGRSHGRR
jgi:crossover junction endodeoxyribonuclease RuvC